MDTLLVNGDHHTGSRGFPVALTGTDELLQRALIRLCVKKGAFAPDARLGSELYKLRGARPAVLDRLALSYAQEALAPLGLTVREASAGRTARDTVLVTVRIAWEGQVFPLEVEL